MPRYALTQTLDKSCGSIALHIAVLELKKQKFEKSKALKFAETTVYKEIQKGKDDYSTPPKMVTYAKSKAGLKAWAMESLPRSTATMIASKGSLLSDWWNYYYSELWKEWVWRYPKGAGSSNLDKGERIIMACGIEPKAGGGLHFLLARKDGDKYYVMDPAYGSDEECSKKDLDEFLGVSGGFFRFGKKQRAYVYIGIAVWLSS